MHPEPLFELTERIMVPLGNACSLEIELKSSGQNFNTPKIYNHNNIDLNKTVNVAHCRARHITGGIHIALDWIVTSDKRVSIKERILYKTLYKPPRFQKIVFRVLDPSVDRGRFKVLIMLCMYICHIPSLPPVAISCRAPRGTDHVHILKMGPCIPSPDT